MIICSKCCGENKDDADYCNQCSNPLDKEAETIEDSRAVVEGKDDSLHAAETSTQLSSRKLSQLIQGKLRAGIPLELAVDASCGEFLTEFSNIQNARFQPKKSETWECPVCGNENDLAAIQCDGCGIVFKDTGKTISCPRCSTPCREGKCSCGAFLTLAELVEYVDPSVLYVCPRCKQLFNAVMVKCADCDAELLQATRLKQYASKFQRQR